MNEAFASNPVAFRNFEYLLGAGIFLNPGRSMRGQNLEGLLIVDRTQADHYIFSTVDELKKVLEASKQDKRNNSGINLWRERLQKSVLDFNSAANQTKENLQKINNGKKEQEKILNGDLMIGTNLEELLTSLNIDLSKRLAGGPYGGMGGTAGYVDPIKRSYDELR